MPSTATDPGGAQQGTRPPEEMGSVCGGKRRARRKLAPPVAQRGAQESRRRRENRSSGWRAATEQGPASKSSFECAPQDVSRSASITDVHSKNTITGVMQVKKYFINQYFYWGPGESRQNVPPRGVISSTTGSEAAARKRRRKGPGGRRQNKPPSGVISSTLGARPQPEKKKKRPRRRKAKCASQWRYQ